MPHLSWWQLSKRFLDSKLFWPDIYLNLKFIKTTNFLDQILLWTHNLLEPTFFWTHKFLYQKLFWPQKNFTSKHFLDPTFFCTLKIFWTKISLDQFFLKPTIFSPQFFFTQNFLRFWSVIEILCRSWSGFGPVSDIIGPVLLCYFLQTPTFNLPCST